MPFYCVPGIMKGEGMEMQSSDWEALLCGYVWLFIHNSLFSAYYEKHEGMTLQEVYSPVSSTKMFSGQQPEYLLSLCSHVSPPLYSLQEGKASERKTSVWYI